MKKIIEALRGAKTMRIWFKRGGALAPSEAVRQRAFTCHGCPKNQKGGMFNWFTRLLADWVLESICYIPYAHPEKLHTCQMCGCALRLMILTPIDVLAMHKTVEEIEKLPDICWVKKELNA